MLRKLYEAGMNIVRLNMSHGDHKTHAKVIRAVKTLNEQIDFPIAILIDTQGPEIRTGHMDSDLQLNEGDKISVSVLAAPRDENCIFIDYQDLIESVSVGDKITVDNGLINLEVLHKQQSSMDCKVLDGGLLKSKRHVNLPGIRVNLPALTAKDRADMAFAVEQEVDYIALSFVRKASDIEELREVLGKKRDKIKVIAKIEDQEGMGNLNHIIEAADGIMIARGDLGVEVPIAHLPNIQRKIVRLCHEAGRRVIVATHLLESMIENPIPTRAEATDVANAIYEEVDAIMLSGETTVGKYPIKCVEYLDQIARSSENVRGLQFSKLLHKTNDKQHLAASAVELAESLQAQGMIVITRRGIMAQYVTNCRPFRVKVFAFTNDNRTRRQLQLNRAVYPFLTAFSKDSEKTLHKAFSILKTRQILQSGDKVVIISDVITANGIDSIQIRTVE